MTSGSITLASTGPFLGLKPRTYLEKGRKENCRLCLHRQVGWRRCSLWVHGACSAGGRQRGRLPMRFASPQLLGPFPRGFPALTSAASGSRQRPGEEHVFRACARGLLWPGAHCSPNPGCPPTISSLCLSLGFFHSWEMTV